MVYNIKRFPKVQKCADLHSSESLANFHKSTTMISATVVDEFFPQANSGSVFSCWVFSCLLFSGSVFRLGVFRLSVFRLAVFRLSLFRLGVFNQARFFQASVCFQAQSASVCYQARFFHSLSVFSGSECYHARCFQAQCVIMLGVFRLSVLSCSVCFQAQYVFRLSIFRILMSTLITKNQYYAHEYSHEDTGFQYIYMRVLMSILDEHTLFRYLMSTLIYVPKSSMLMSTLKYIPKFSNMLNEHSHEDTVFWYYEGAHQHTGFWQLINVPKVQNPVCSSVLSLPQS